MTGLGNYSRLVIESLAKEYPESDFLVYTPVMKENPRLDELKRLHNVEFRLPGPHGFHGSLWRSFGITNNLGADKVDLFHGLSNELPLNIKEAHIPTVVTIHDVIWRVLPHTFSLFDRKIDDFKYGRSCRNATRIIAVSENTKKDIVKFYGIDPEKIDVVYQGCDNSFKTFRGPDELESIKQRLGLPERYILQVGTIEERKNLELTVRALSSVNPEVKLLAVGKDRKGYKGKVLKTAQECGVMNRIVFRDNISFADLPAVNRLAEIVLYPSRYEGFGIPVIEGLESERPVIAAKGSCLEEAGGDGSIYVDPDNPRELAQAINSILDGGVDVETMVRQGKKHAKQFDNSCMASRIMDVYHKAEEDFSKISRIS